MFSEQSTQIHPKDASDLHCDLGVNSVRKEIENIETKHNTRLRDHVNTSPTGDPIGLERRLKTSLLVITTV